MSPRSSPSSSSHDATGNLTRQKDAKRQTQTFGYDEQGRLRFTHDAPGRVTETRRLLDGTTYTLPQSYDALGRVVTRTFPDTDTVT